MKIQEEYLTKIRDLLKDKLEPTLIILFGSAVKGNFRPDSDLDIAFYSEKEIDSYQVFMIAQKVAELVSRDVDLVNLKEASTVFRAQIIGEGEVILSTDDQFEINYKIRTLKEYALLNEERQEIIERIRKEGKVYE